MKLELSSVKRRGFLTMIGGAAAIALLAVTVIATGAVEPFASQEAADKPGRPDLEPIAGADVVRAKLFPSGSGYALTTSSLHWTQDYGQTWEEITPSGISADQISAVSFLEDGHGWVAREDGGSVTILTKDSAAVDSWRTVSDLDVDTIQAQPKGSQRMEMNFLDAMHGWLLVDTANSVKFSTAVLMATEDGGETWFSRTAPAYGRFRFVSPTVGFLAGGPASADLFISSDAGASWTKAAIPEATEHRGDALTLFGQPMLLAEGVAVGISWVGPSGENNGVGLLLSKDQGKTWTIRERPSDPTDLAYAVDGIRGTSTVALFTVKVSGEAITSISNDVGLNYIDIESSFKDSTAIPAPLELSISNDNILWLVGGIGACRGPSGTDCFQSSGLFISVDGEATWNLRQLP